MLAEPRRAQASRGRRKVAEPDRVSRGQHRLLDAVRPCDRDQHAARRELTYLSYLIVPTDLATGTGFSTSKGYTLGAFGSYLLCQGQQHVNQLGYAALPVNLVGDSYQQLSKVPGASLPGSLSAFLTGCDNPTITSSGTDALSNGAPMPPACDQKGPTQCTSPVLPEGTATVTAVSASPASAIPGQAVTLTATVTSASGTPPGSVQFEVAGTLVGSPVPGDSSGVATTTETFTTAGVQVVSAVFTPDNVTDFQPSAGVVNVIVLPTISSIVPLATTIPPAGAFTLTVPSTGMVSMTVSGSSAAGDILPVVVSDSRNTYPGWSVSGQASDFTTSSPGPDTIISGNELGWMPDTTASLASGVMPGGAVQAAAPGLGSAPATLASASAGAGFGTSTLGAHLSLVIPPTAVPGPYTSVLTLTAVTSAP